MIDFDHRKPFTFDRVVRIGLAVLLIVGIVYLLRRLSGPLVPFVIAALLAYLINPLVNFLQVTFRLKSRLPAVLLSLVGITMLFVLLTWLVVPAIVRESEEMSQLLSNYVSKYKEDGQRPDEALSGLLPASWEQSFHDLMAREDIQSLLDPSSLSKVAQMALNEAWGLINYSYRTILGIFGLFVIALYLVFILLDYDALRQAWKNYLPPNQANMIVRIGEDLERSMRIYFRAQGLIALINGVLFAFGFWLIGLPMGIILGLFTGLLNMVPYLQLAALIPATLLGLIQALESGNPFWLILVWILVVFLVVSLIEQAILTPRIMGEATGMNPAVIMLSLSIWGSLLGMLGLIIALPLTSVMASWYRQYLLDHHMEPEMDQNKMEGSAIED